MSDENTVYYIAAGKSLEAIRQWQKEVPEIDKKRKAYLKSLGLKSGSSVLMHDGSSSMTGVCVEKDEKVPAGFLASRHRKGTYVPDRRTVIGKQRKKELAELNCPRLDIGGIFIHGLKGHWPGFETHGDKFIISQHKNAPPPPDAIPLKQSEYWAMKEAEDKPVE